MFIEQVRGWFPGITPPQIEQQIDDHYASWFKEYGQKNLPRDSHLYHLSQGPLNGVMSYNICFVNGYKFHTDSYGKSKSTVNSGVCIRGSNYSYAEDDFYGILKEVVEVEYRASPIKKVVLFNCAWYNPAPPPRGGTIVHPKYKIVEVNIQKEYPKYDPFVLAQQASQIYFVSFPSKKKDKVNWRAVLKVRAKKFDYLITKEADEDTAFQEDEVEVHEISDDMEFVESSRHDPSGAMIPILREIADDEEEGDDDDGDDDNVDDDENEDEDEEDEEE